MKKLTHSTGAKVCAIILITIAFITAFASCIGISYVGGYGAYDSYSEPYDVFYRSLAADCCYKVIVYYGSYEPYTTDEYTTDENGALALPPQFEEHLQSRFKGSGFAFTVTDDSGRELPGSGEIPADGDYLSCHTSTFAVFTRDAASGYREVKEFMLSVTAYVLQDAARGSVTGDSIRLFDTLYPMSYTLIIALCVSAVVMLILFVFLMAAAGMREGADRAQCNMFDRIPADIHIAVLAALFLMVIYAIDAMRFDDTMMFAVILGMSVPLFLLALHLCMSIATRIKTGTLIKGSLIYFVLHGIFIRLLLPVWRGIPMVWRTVALIAVLTVINFIALGSLLAGGAVIIVVEYIIIVPCILYIAITMRRLQEGGRRLAAGDLNYWIDDSHMLWDFKKHAEDLNSISVGMAKAVDERMRSERMKTELITNVSHDIKTPLTSIINYVDLLKKEPAGSEAAAGYLEVLDRQSGRLKKLIEDLVEASKASTGSIKVDLAPCDAGVLLAQAAGEYDARLSAAGLELICDRPDEPVMITADGRYLWRVFDNLLSNICKYSLPSTRVYLSLFRRNGRVLITFKNISRYPLNISTDELMERFVRGDASRSTEGSGLGLSIANSLVDLMGGRIGIAVDGDLFKVTLSFDEI